MDDLVFASFDLKKLFSALYVVNHNSMIIVNVNTGDISFAWTDRYAAYPAGTFLQLECKL